MKIVSEPRENLSSFLHQIKFIVFKRERLKKVYSATFFTDIYRIENIDRISLQLKTSRFHGNFDVIFEGMFLRYTQENYFKALF